MRQRIEGTENRRGQREQEKGEGHIVNRESAEYIAGFYRIRYWETVHSCAKQQ